MSLFFAVVWRSKRLLLAGVALGVVLAALAYGQPTLSGGKPTLKPRGSEVWQSESQLLIAQAGFPYRQAPEATEPARSLGGLSPIYANLANGGLVQGEILRKLGPIGSVKATEDVDVAAATFLPFVTFTASAPTAGAATRLARGSAQIFEKFVARQQAANGIPAERRIQLTAVEAGFNTRLVEGHKLSIPLLVFFAVLIATISAIFLKQNLRQREALEAAASSNQGLVPSNQQPHAVPANQPHAVPASQPPHEPGPLAVPAREPLTVANGGAANGGSGAGATIHRGRDPVASARYRA
ncbi:MAG TPA: hypothetical protein VNV42_15735 [Solirubrobacteraceae bacterium]|nr:hypothetical protein [Solirubrobacteraceae bacterium]